METQQVCVRVCVCLDAALGSFHIDVQKGQSDEGLTIP